MLGKNGGFGGLLESMVNGGLEGEMEGDVRDEEGELGNGGNGKMEKEVESGLGEVRVCRGGEGN